LYYLLLLLLLFYMLLLLLFYMLLMLLFYMLLLLLFYMLLMLLLYMSRIPLLLTPHKLNNLWHILSLLRLNSFQEVVDYKDSSHLSSVVPSMASLTLHLVHATTWSPVMVISKCHAMTKRKNQGHASAVQLASIHTIQSFSLRFVKEESP